MKRKSNHKKYKFTYIKATVGTLFLCLLWLRGYTPYEETGENFFHITLNGQDMGTLDDKDRIDCSCRPGRTWRPRATSWYSCGRT